MQTLVIERKDHNVVVLCDPLGKLFVSSCVLAKAVDDKHDPSLITRFGEPQSRDQET